MSILEKFFKNKKGSSEKLEEKPLEYDRTYVYHHAKSVLEDGELYDTSAYQKAFTDFTTLEKISYAASISRNRTYFLSPNGKWFSAEKETEIKKRKITDVGKYRVQTVTVIFTYSDLRIESVEAVESMIVKNRYDL